MEQKNITNHENDIVCYLENGTKLYGRQIPEEGFCVLFSLTNNSYWYSGQNLLFSIDSELASLHDFIRNIISDDTTTDFIDYPLFISELGLSSDWNNSLEEFQKKIEKAEKIIPNLYRELYISDVQLMISAVQNLLVGIEASLIDYYRLISEVNVEGFVENKIYVCGGYSAAKVVTALGNFFTKIYSVLDLLTKIAYEIESKQEAFDKYPKLKSNHILYGQKDKLSIDNKPGSLFEKDEFMTMIESFRNEIVHNGSWEALPKVFVKLENRKPVERFVLFPDMIEGRYARYKNRHHFYSGEKQVNYCLPIITKEFYRRLFITILYIKNPELTPEMADFIFQREKSRWEHEVI